MKKIWIKIENIRSPPSLGSNLLVLKKSVRARPRGKLLFLRAYGIYDFMEIYGFSEFFSGKVYGIFRSDKLLAPGESTRVWSLSMSMLVLLSGLRGRGESGNFDPLI